MASILRSPEGTILPADIQPPPRYKKFFITIRSVDPRSVMTEFCADSMSYWINKLRSGQPFTDGDSFQAHRAGKEIQGRGSIDPVCFAKDTLTVSYSGDDHHDTFYSFEYRRNWVSISTTLGNWFEFTGGEFQMGVPLDAGPVILAGSCYPVEAPKP